MTLIIYHTYPMLTVTIYPNEVIVWKSKRSTHSPAKNETIISLKTPSSLYKTVSHQKHVEYIHKGDGTYYQSGLNTTRRIPALNKVFASTHKNRAEVESLASVTTIVTKTEDITIYMLPGGSYIKEVISLVDNTKTVEYYPL